MILLYLKRMLLLMRAGVRSVEVYTYSKADKPDSIFRTTGDMAVPYCKAHEGAVRTSYTDGSCLYPEEGDLVVTFHSGQRAIVTPSRWP